MKRVSKVINKLERNIRLRDEKYDYKKRKRENGKGKNMIIIITFGGSEQFNWFHGY